MVVTLLETLARYVTPSQMFNFVKNASLKTGEREDYTKGNDRYVG